MPRIRTASRGFAPLALVTLALIVVCCEAPAAVGPTAPAAAAIVATQAPDAPDSEATPVDEATARPEAVPPAPTASAAAASTSAAASAIVPGAVQRTSLAITATYDVAVRLGVADRRLAGRATIRSAEPLRRRHRPPPAQHRDGQARRARPPLGDGRRQGRGRPCRRPDGRRPSRRRAARWRGDHHRRPVRGPPPPRRSPARIGCSPAPTASSTCTAGSRGSAASAGSSGPTTATRS